MIHILMSIADWFVWAAGMMIALLAIGFICCAIKDCRDELCKLKKKKDEEL